MDSPPALTQPARGSDSNASRAPKRIRTNPKGIQTGTIFILYALLILSRIEFERSQYGRHYFLGRFNLNKDDLRLTPTLALANVVNADVNRLYFGNIGF